MEVVGSARTSHTILIISEDVLLMIPADFGDRCTFDFLASSLLHHEETTGRFETQMTWLSDAGYQTLFTGFSIEKE